MAKEQGETTQIYFNCIKQEKSGKVFILKDDILKFLGTIAIKVEIGAEGKKLLKFMADSIEKVDV